MKKPLKEFKARALKDLEKIRGGGEGEGDNVIDRDKIRRPQPGKK